MGCRYLLLDANIVATYYLPESCPKRNASKVQARIRSLIDSVRFGHLKDTKLLIPSICVPEVFGVFAKYRFSSWNAHVTEPIDDLRYWRCRLAFRNDIHNGRLISQVDISRYHILATDLISTVDHYYEVYRSRNKRQRNKRPMGTSDHLVIGMGIHLVKTRGANNVTLLTSDHRMGKVVKRAQSIKVASAARLGLLRTARDLGLSFSPEIYPVTLNLANASNEDLLSRVGSELKDAVCEISEVSRRGPKLSTKHANQLGTLYKRLTNKTSESLAYSDDFEILYEAFIAKTGLELSRSDLFRVLSNRRKAGYLAKRGKLPKTE